MKKLVVLLQLITIHAVVFSQSSYSLKFDEKEFSFLESEAGYQILPNNADYYFLGDTALPALPYKNIYILVAENTTIEDVNISFESEKVAQDVYLIKNPLIVPGSENSGNSGSSGNYAENTYPDANLNFETITKSQGFYMAALSVCPFIYQAQQQTLELITEMTISINQTVTESTNSNTERYDMEAVVSSLVLNPEEMNTLYPQLANLPPRSATGDVEYLIITTDSLKASFAPLKTWKTRKGIKTEIVSTEYIYANYTGSTNQIKIKKCLQDYYENKNLKWALLGGDDVVVPAQICYVREPFGNRTDYTPCDLFYACFDNAFDWNANGNALIGEPSDNVDMNPEIYISRLPVRNAEHVSAFVDKLLKYETDPARSNYVKKMLLAGTRLWKTWNGQSDAHQRSEKMYNENIAPFWNGTKYRFYDTGTDFTGGATYNLTSANLQTQIDNGYHFLHMATHGLTASWGMEIGGSYHSLNNACTQQNENASIIVTISCHTNGFDKATDPCLSEAFIRNPNGACIAYLGSSRFGWGNDDTTVSLGPSFLYNAKFYNRLFNGLPSSDSYRFGALTSTTKQQFIGSSNSYGTMRWLQFSLNAIGCPEMPIYTADPLLFTNVVVSINGSSVTVNANKSGCTIVISSIDDGQSYFQVAENVSSYTFTDVNFSSNITITKHNYIPYLNDFCTLNTGVQEDIIQNTTWDTNTFVPEVVNIKDNATLSISGTVSFAPNAKIIVEQGAKLVVDGGTLTSACIGQPWHGIEVWGTASESQHPNNNPALEELAGKQWQGTLELKNGAIIENALCAVALWKPGDSTTAGGILKAYDATFRNNAQSIHAPRYRNYNPYNPSSEMQNLSNLYRCTFVIDSGYPAIAQFNNHVELTKVWGINFTACDFSVDRTLDSVSYYASGIAAYSAGFFLNGGCNDPGPLQTVPCQNHRYNTFEGFYHGIYATNDGSNNHLIGIYRCEFTNNVHGVRFENVSNSNLSSNLFKIGKGSVTGCTTESGFGIRMQNSSGYNIVDNDFTKYGTSSTGDYYGIAILVPDPPTSEEIYRNSFSSLKYANYVDGKAQRLGKLDPTLGVLYQCNSNTGNYADFFSPNNSTRSFQPSQGSVSKAAGNTFSLGATRHIYNGSNTLVTYYYLANTSEQTPAQNKTYNVTRSLTTNANPCTTGNGGLADRSLDRDSLTAVYDDALENYNNVNTLYESLKDGGSTTQLQVEIQTAQPNDMWEIRAELLGISPHLSDTVLLEVADKTTVFSEAAIFDIMAANPDELKNLDLLTYLEQKENPLPEYMINILYQVAGGTTYKTALLEQMASYNHEKSRAANAMIRSFVEDTISTKNDSIRAWYAKLGGLESDKRIIASYIEENDFETALSIAESMSEIYNFDETQQIEHERYVNILELHQTLFDENRYMDQLDENELAMLETYAQQSQGTSGSIARGILAHFYDQHFDSCPCTDEDNSLKSGAISPTDLAKIYGMRVETHPNPANTWIAFDYRLPENAAKATLTITDLQGRVVTTIELAGQQGQYLFDTRQLPSGTYLYSLQANDKQVNGKFAVAR